MGLSPFSYSTSEGYKPKCGNPNPIRFKIMDCFVFESSKQNINTVLVVKYDGVTNFEGIKILFYRNIDPKVLTNLTSLDPHFAKEGISPFARFEPTKEGLLQALNLAQSMEVVTNEREPLTFKISKKWSYYKNKKR